MKPIFRLQAVAGSLARRYFCCICLVVFVLFSHFEQCQLLNCNDNLGNFNLKIVIPKRFCAANGIERLFILVFCSTSRLTLLVRTTFLRGKKICFTAPLWYFESRCFFLMYSLFTIKEFWGLLVEIELQKCTST